MTQCYITHHQLANASINLNRPTRQAPFNTKFMDCAQPAAAFHVGQPAAGSNRFSLNTSPSPSDTHHAEDDISHHVRRMSFILSAIAAGRNFNP
jgi:hypothetical protein